MRSPWLLRTPLLVLGVTAAAAGVWLYLRPRDEGRVRQQLANLERAPESGRSVSMKTADMSNAQEAPLCQSTADMKRLDQKRVRLVGIYRKYLEPTKMPRPGRPPPPPEFMGRAYIEVQGPATAYDPRLSDEAPGRVQLGEAARPAAEITEWEGKKIEVSGLLVLAPIVDNTVARPRPLPQLVEAGPLRASPGSQ